MILYVRRHSDSCTHTPSSIAEPFRTEGHDLLPPPIAMRTCQRKRSSEERTRRRLPAIWSEARLRVEPATMSSARAHAHYSTLPSPAGGWREPPRLANIRRRRTTATCCFFLRAQRDVAPRRRHIRRACVFAHIAYLAANCCKNLCPMVKTPGPTSDANPAACLAASTASLGSKTPRGVSGEPAKGRP